MKRGLAYFNVNVVLRISEINVLPWVGDPDVEVLVLLKDVIVLN